MEVDAFFKVNRDKDAYIVPKNFLQGIVIFCSRL